MSARGWIALAALAVTAHAGDWTPAVDVRHDEEVAVSYQARVDGPYLVVRATVGNGWHTFAMDNKKRADEKLAGKAALSVDRPTEIVGSGLQIAGPWYQTPPKDFSRPELRWFSWGFERQAVFAAKIGKAGAAARLTLKGQACTETVCKNIDVTIPLAAANLKGGATSSELSLSQLTAVR